MNCENPQYMMRRAGINPRTGKHFPPFSSKHETAFAMAQFHLGDFEEILVPCGKCFSCLKQRAFDISVRAFHESLTHKENSFVTLTFDEDHKIHSLDHKIFQDFMKRLRKRLGCKKIRYIMCGEYGEKSERAHFHAVLFGISPDERKKIALVRNDDSLLGSDRPLYAGFYRSEVIEKSWPFGNVYIGSVSPASIAYVAGYTLKAFTLGRNDAWYKERCLKPEYHKWSRRPGLGLAWYEKNKTSLFDHGYDLFGKLVCNDKVRFVNCGATAPRYYTEKLYLHDRDKFDILQIVRDERSKERSASDAHICIEKLHERASVMMNRLDSQKFKVASRRRA